MPVLRTSARLDDAGRQQRSIDDGSPCRAARHGVDTTDPRRAMRAHGEFKMSCAGDARRDSTVRASPTPFDAAESTWIVESDPPTVRAARYVVDTTNPRRATRTLDKFKMSCAGDARRFSTVRAPPTASDGVDRRGSSTATP